MSMVLQTLAQGVRRADSENLPPTQAAALKGATTKHNRLLTAIHNDTRRKLTSPSSSSSTQHSKQRVELAKKRKALKKSKPASQKLESQMGVEPAPPALADVTMEESCPPKPVTLHIPLELPKPPVRPIPESSLSGLALEQGAEWYRNEMCDTKGSLYMDILGRTTPDCSTFVRTPSGQGEVEVAIQKFTLEDMDVLPTHVVAVWGPQPANPVIPTPVKLFPVHGDMLRTHCASLPKLPSEIPVHLPLSNEPSTFHLSLASQTLCLPAPEQFAPLHRYFCDHNTPRLLRDLLLFQIPEDFEDNQAQIPAFGYGMAKQLTYEQLKMRATNITGVWRNAHALGVVDDGDGLWDSIEVAWETILHALTHSKPELLNDSEEPEFMPS